MAVQVLKWRPRGPVGFAPIDTTVTPNRPGPFQLFDCVDQITLALTTTFVTHEAKCGPVDTEDFRMIKNLQGALTISMTNHTPAAMVMALQGKTNIADVAPVVIAEELLPIVPAAGGIVALGGANANYNITSLSLTDSTVSAELPLVLNTDYTFDPVFGIITLNNMAGFVQPIEAAYSYQNPLILAAMNAGEIRRWVRFNGQNYANAGKITPVNLFNVSIEPTKNFDFEPDDHGKLDLQCAVLLDQSRLITDARGQFMDIGLAA